MKHIAVICSNMERYRNYIAGITNWSTVPYYQGYKYVRVEDTTYYCILNLRDSRGYYFDDYVCLDSYNWPSRDFDELMVSIAMRKNLKPKTTIEIEIEAINTMGYKDYE